MMTITTIERARLHAGATLGCVPTVSTWLRRGFAVDAATTDARAKAYGAASVEIGASLPVVSHALAGPPL